MHMLFFGTFVTYARCFAGIFILSLVEAIARAIQLGAFGDVSGITYALLELPVWLARVGIFFVILGDGNPLRWQKGVKQLAEYMRRPFGLARSWKPVILQTLLFGIFVFIINAGSETVAGIIANQNYAPFLQKPEPITFFIKNMTVIPFTLVFVYQAFCFIQKSPSESK